MKRETFEYAFFQSLACSLLAFSNRCSPPPSALYFASLTFFSYWPYCDS